VYFQDASDESKHLVRNGCSMCGDAAVCQTPVTVTDDYLNSLTVGMDFECEMLSNKAVVNTPSTGGGDVLSTSLPGGETGHAEASPAAAVVTTTTMPEDEGLGGLLFPLLAMVIAVVLGLAAFLVWKFVIRKNRGSQRSGKSTKKGKGGKQERGDYGQVPLMEDQEAAPTRTDLQANRQDMLPATMQNIVAEGHPQMEQLMASQGAVATGSHPQLEQQAAPATPEPGPVGRHPQQEQQYAPTITSMSHLTPPTSGPPPTSTQSLPPEAQQHQAGNSAYLPTGILAPPPSMTPQQAGQIDQARLQQQLQQQYMEQQMQASQQMQSSQQLQSSQQMMQSQLQMQQSHNLQQPPTSYSAAPATTQLGGMGGAQMPSTQYDVVTVTPQGYSVTPYQGQVPYSQNLATQPLVPPQTSYGY